MAPPNAAAQLTAVRAHPLVVQSVPYPTPGEGEIIIKVAAAAVNPMDWMIQTLGENLFPWLQYPLTLGNDAAGTVVEVGPGVTKFKVGDRVVGLNAASMHAAPGLFQKDLLALDYPSVDNVKPNGKTLLVWAGASSVGSNAVQLAAAAGYEVITTSSPKNFDYCKKLGASQVFDYNSKTITQDLIKAFEGKTSAGGFAVHPASAEIVFEVVAKSNGTKFVTTAFEVPEKVPEGIVAKMVWGGSLKDNEVGPLIFDQYLPAALAKKKFQCAPHAVVFGEGLDKVQDAWDQLKAQGASAKKLVITL
ncbi:hypothetical protein NUW58_g296 [Xylaria curta]|uniref:Uncharacterized protein n=1 Tax=Xylaria curta TaxID=42375 RepID=A0ACC1PSH0_9PEZI|nr:hypothetical protein NUW58_g296 [Xylaria curta]